jgi:phosphoribosylformylglycinamidine synthase
MGFVRRLYVEKRGGFNVKASGLKRDLCENLGVSIGDLRVLYRYDISGMDDDEFMMARASVFSEPAVDSVYDETFPHDDGARVFAVELLPGQYDQHADSAAQCVQLLTQKERPEVRVATVYALTGDISKEDLRRIKDYVINPVESREASMDKPDSLETAYDVPGDVAVLDGFCGLDGNGLKQLHESFGLAMHREDLAFCQRYFRDEGRDPTITELRVIDTYWSDHCRHTTFATRIVRVDIDEGPFMAAVARAQEEYEAAREKVYGKDTLRPVCLMDLATICMKEAKENGWLDDLDESEEINACSIRATVDVDGREEAYLVMFKNETHNHPTEIEPFGGAATCLGGAIRDPLSGRAYVYHAMRVTGCGDPRARVEDTLPGKLPQRKLTVGAAQGFSSYGNQIGLATGLVDEVYHPAFVAKRMEIGAVIAAAPAQNVVRGRPQKGDAVILVGGRTGRDGCGGATGSSKAHDEQSILVCGAEVQRGNPITERKMQRLFRDPAFSRLVKRCNDFGAGGVSVAIGELAPGLDIDLDAVPKKYEGLDGTELAISESQERMAVVVAPGDVAQVFRLCAAENLEATKVAQVTGEGRMRMRWRNKTIVDISREFLDTNGVAQSASVRVQAPRGDYFASYPQGGVTEVWPRVMAGLNVCSKKGLAERFDSTIGAATVLMPYGGARQLTPLQSMAARIPVLQGETRTGTIMSYGYDPYLACWSPFHGAVYAVVCAVCKVAAAGGEYKKTRLSLQEYFERPYDKPERWGKPYAALLGAGLAQRALGIPAIGGKDSMSGTFKDLDVPPTLCAFAVCVGDIENVISPEFKKAGDRVALLSIRRGADGLPDFAELERTLEALEEAIHMGRVVSAFVVDSGGLAGALARMAFGNGLGLRMEGEWDGASLFAPLHGDIVVELAPYADMKRTFGHLAKAVGTVSEKPEIRVNGAVLPLEKLESAWAGTLEDIFPTRTEESAIMPQSLYTSRNTARPAASVAAPRVVIPVFPGTNCEYDSARAFERAGAKARTVIIRNLTPPDIEESIRALAEAIDQAQILMIPGGFSGGDEPDGSGKFIATMLKNPRIRDALMRLLGERDGLALGICNGFQALIKVGLVPYGDIRDMRPDSPTLTFNTIGRHMSRLVDIRVTSTLSPWFANVQAGEVFTEAVSHGEGRFVASAAEIEDLFKNGQVAAQYVDASGLPSMDTAHNPNGSMCAIEAITSPDGRVLGKMGHSERYRPGLYLNVPGNKDRELFESGVAYFR